MTDSATTELPDIPESRAYVLRTVNADGTSYHGFAWNLDVGAINEAPDWDTKAECGGGLHGLLDGYGNYGLLSDSLDAKWLIVEVERAWCVDIDQKVKFPACTIAHVGDMASAMTRISQYQIKLLLKAASRGEITDFAKGEGKSAASSGNSSKAASSGDYSKAASSGDYSKAASSGDSSTAASSGYSSTAASSGDSSTAASSGYYSKAASSGNYSTAASSGYSSTAASSGNYSKAASSGYSSTAASSGDKTIAMVAGFDGRAKAGPNGCIALAFDDGKRPRIVVGYVGEGIETDTFYRVEKGQLVKV